MNKDKVLKLQVYVESLKNSIKTSVILAKKEFFERELRKTELKIRELNQ